MMMNTRKKLSSTFKARKYELFILPVVFASALFLHEKCENKQNFLNHLFV